MKILYAIQGAGNSHINRARDMIPVIQKYCEVEVLISGYRSNAKIPLPIKYNFNGINLKYGKKGNIDMWNTYIEASLKKFRDEIKSLPVEKYDFIINDFEPVSAWACYTNNIPCVALSHQAAIIDNNSPKPNKQDLFGRFILKNYAPSNLQFGFHFGRYSPNIYTPVIREEIRNIKVSDKGHYIVYLPSIEDTELIKFLSGMKEIKWQIFSKRAYKLYKENNIEIHPYNNKNYIESLRNCSGLFCEAGFNAPAEALFLGKKLLILSRGLRYEQKCNAAALKNIGIPIIKKLNVNKIEKVQNWIKNGMNIQIEYKDITDQVIRKIFEIHVSEILKNNWKEEFNLQYIEESNISTSISSFSSLLQI